MPSAVTRATSFMREVEASCFSPSHIETARSIRPSINTAAVLPLPAHETVASTLVAMRASKPPSTRIWRADNEKSSSGELMTIKSFTANSS
jgi:hypothetical protein